MFWKKKIKPDWWLITFGIIALFIILATAILVADLLSREGSFMENSKSISVDVLDDLAENILKVDENYKKEIQELYEYVSEGDDLSDVYKVVEESFFKVRVPEEMRNLHLQTLLEIYDLKEKESNDDVSVVINKDLGKIKNIIESFEIQ